MFRNTLGLISSHHQQQHIKVTPSALSIKDFNCQQLALPQKSLVTTHTARRGRKPGRGHKTAGIQTAENEKESNSVKANSDQLSQGPLEIAQHSSFSFYRSKQNLQYMASIAIGVRVDSWLYSMKEGQNNKLIFLFILLLKAVFS